MRRLWCVGLFLMVSICPAFAASEDMERVAANIAYEIRNNLLSVEASVAYVGMDGSRAYLVGDVNALRPGLPVIFFRNGAPIVSQDSPPQVVGRESLQIGQGRISAIHDRAAWVQVDPGATGKVVKGDYAVVQLDAPTVRATPFFVDEGAGRPMQDGRGRILRSLLLYDLKHMGLAVEDAPLLESEVDATGLPMPSALNQFDTSGVLLIGRVMPKPGSADELIVGIALFDLNLREMRLARSFEVRTLPGFTPPGMAIKMWRERESQAPAPAPENPVPAVSAPPPVSKEEPPMREPVDQLKGVCRMFVPSNIRLEWPPKTPGDEMVAGLLAPTLPDIVIEWIEDTAAVWRLKLPPGLSAPFSINAREIVSLLSARSREPAAHALIGSCKWTAISENEIGLTLEKPLSDIRDRLAAPEFRLITDRYEPLGSGAGPYRLASQGARTVVLEKTPAARSIAMWANAPDTLALAVERDPNKRAKGFDDGDADVHEILDDEAMRFGPGTNSRVVQGSPEELIAVAFNLRRPPMSIVHFRRMMAMLIDRKTVFEVSLNQRGEPAENFLPPDAKNITSVLVKMPESSKLAAQVLAREFSDSGRLTLMFPLEEPHYGLIAESIRSDASALNISIQPQGLSWRAYVDRLNAGDFDLALVSIPYAPPYRLWAERNFSSTGGKNLWGYRNSIVDTLLGETGDIGAALDLIHSDVPMIPMFWLSRRIVLGPRVSDAWPSAFPQKFISSIRLK